MQIKISDKLGEQIKSYCKLNGLTITKYVEELLQKEFVIDKYGMRPPFGKKEETIEEPIINEVDIKEEPKEITTYVYEESKNTETEEDIKTEVIEEEQHIEEQNSQKPKKTIKRKLK